MESVNQDETQALPPEPGGSQLNDETLRVPVDSMQGGDQPIETGSMSPEGGETVAVDLSAGSGGPDEPAARPAPGNVPWRWIVVVGLLALLLIAAASAYGGYLSGIDQREHFESTQIAVRVSEQYELGIQDMEAGRYELARQRFEYVIQLDPSYPGVTDNLARVLLELNTTATPTFVPTPTLTPTPDLRGAEELFSQAQVMLADERWTEAIDTLLKLRKDEPDYNTIEVDSMLYVALRNRGVFRILNEGDLEGGTYDLALAERFGPLDIEATNMRTWADLYVTGASFWGLDWGQASFYFGQIVAVAPNLRDNTNMTASERYHIATLEWGDALAANKEWCLAQQAYEAAYNFSLDPALEPTVAFAADKCREAERPGGNQQPPPPAEATPTPGATGTVVPTTEPPPQGTPTPGTTEPYPAPTQ
jgi:tetratricopeptide (TPR) repeat protein